MLKSLKLAWPQIKRKIVICVAIVLCIPISAYCGLDIYRALLSGKPLEKFTGDTMLSLLSFLTIIAGVFAWVFETIIRRDIVGEIEEERIASKANADYTAGYVLWVQHHAHYRVNQPGLIAEALSMARLSANSSSTLNPAKFQELICKCKNNYAFFLAATGRPEFKDEAFKLAKYIHSVAISEEGKKYDLRYTWKATWALVLLRFYRDDEPSKRKVCGIVKELLDDEEIPQDARKQLKEGWEYIEQKPFSHILEEVGFC